MVSPSWPGDRPADTADVSAAVTADIAATAAAIGAAVVDGAVAVVATQDASGLVSFIKVTNYVHTSEISSDRLTYSYIERLEPSFHSVARCFLCLGSNFS